MGWLTSGSARTLVIESDEFSLRAAVVNVSRRNPRVEAVSQILPRNVWTALPAALERLSGVRIPKRAVVLSSDVVPTVLRLPLSPGSARSWQQMQQLLRWEFDALVAQHFVPRPLGEILVCRGLLTDEQYRSVRESAGLEESAAGNLGDRAIERLLEQTVMEHGQGSRSDLDDCLAIQERLEQPLPEEDLVCGWAHPARTTESRNAARSVDGLQPWFACGMLRSVRDNWREELAQLGFRLAGIGPLAGCSTGFGQLTGEDASILEIRPGRIGLTEIRAGRIEDVRLLPVSQSAPTAEQCQSVLDQKSPHAIWLAGTHPDLTGLAEHMAASLEQPVKVLEPAKDPGVHAPGSMTPLIGAASSIPSVHLDKSPVAAVVARDPAPPLRQRPPFWWTAVVCATVLLIGSVEFLTQQQFREVDTNTNTEEEKLALYKGEAERVQRKTEKINQLNGQLTETQSTLEVTTTRSQFLNESVPQRIQFVPALLTAVAGASSESIVVNRISESVTGSTEIEAWSLTLQAAQRCIQSLETRLKPWGLVMQEPRVQSKIGRLDLPGYLIKLNFAEIEAGSPNGSGSSETDDQEPERSRPQSAAPSQTTPEGNTP
ncbi:MAG TPA: hypothetical protein DCE39_00650 [Planctomycetaceae bacterium]|nr:hypothetical protein [Planctomycetaceae bacterium]|tara:strand:- start:7319 stop:9124 length:1806 start_codon:yes stop_codon:yes gene_type:complete